MKYNSFEEVDKLPEQSDESPEEFANRLMDELILLYKKVNKKENNV